MNFIKTLFLILTLFSLQAEFLTAQTISSIKGKSTFVKQTDNDFFRSGGGFRIDLPKSFTLSKELSFNDGKISGFGKCYYWEDPQAYEYRVAYYKLDTGKKSLTEIEKTAYLETYQKGFMQDFKAANLPFIEKKYVFNGSDGMEIQAINSAANSKMLTRFFIVGRRLYFIDLVYNPKRIDDSQVLQIADSFALLDSKALIDAKIEEATPASLPQTPVAAKLKPDAADKNLKGKVKSVIEEMQDPNPKLKRERFSEEYYDESGNLTKEISFDEGLPDFITFWGYIDGNRVSNTGSIDFDDDQRPPPRHFSIKATMEDDSNLPRDSRYGIKYAYKYNETGQLSEQITYQNNGKLSGRIVYNYQGNRREELHYGPDGSEWSQTIEFLNKDGNVLERDLMEKSGKIANKEINTYEFDSQGNWIVQKTLEENIVKGKKVRKPSWTSYRTITYYP
jgi:hypothetical protein